MHRLRMWNERQAREFPAVEENGTVVEDMLEKAVLRDFQRADFPERNVHDVLAKPQTSLGTENAFIRKKDARHAAAEDAIESYMMEEEQEYVACHENDDGGCVIPVHERGAERRADERGARKRRSGMPPSRIASNAPVEGE